MLVCKNCERSNHPHYDKKYGGYCLDCSNAGVPELDEKIAKLEERLALAARELPKPDDRELWELREYAMSQRERVEALEAERDDARSACGRLLEALRDIKAHGDRAGGSMDEMCDIAREAIQKEEGGQG